jgi:dihydrofolate reductase
MYETMTSWETLQTHDQPPYIEDFANIWRATEKVVYSSTLRNALTARTLIEPKFEPEAVRAMKACSPTDITIGGSTLAAHAFRAGLIDVCHLFISPILVGGGNNAFPRGFRLNLTLQQERRFTNGMVFLHYRSSEREAA